MYDFISGLIGAVAATLVVIYFGTLSMPVEDIPDFKQQAIKYCESETGVIVEMQYDNYTIKCENGARIQFNWR